MRQIGLEFGQLTSEQQMKLDRFIQNHTVAETKKPRLLKPGFLEGKQPAQ